MNIYEFQLDDYINTTTIRRTVLEVEEKSKVYKCCNKSFYPLQINKNEIGVLKGYANNTVYLLEDDLEKAKSLFAENIKCQIAKYKKEIEKLELRAIELGVFELPQEEICECRER